MSRSHTYRRARRGNLIGARSASAGSPRVPDSARRPRLGSSTPHRISSSPASGQRPPMASAPRPLLPSARTGRPPTATRNSGGLRSQRRCGSARRARCASRSGSGLGPRTPGHTATAPARPAHRAGDRQPVPDGWASRSATSGRTCAARSASTYRSQRPRSYALFFRRRLLKGQLARPRGRISARSVDREIARAHEEPRTGRKVCSGLLRFLPAAPAGCLVCAITEVLAGYTVHMRVIAAIRCAAAPPRGRLAPTGGRRKLGTARPDEGVAPPAPAGRWGSV